MKEVTPQVYEWSQYEPARRLDLNGHFVQSAPGEPGALIDPVPFLPGDEDQLRELGGVAAVVVTGPGRTQEATACAARLGCAVLASRPVVEQVDYGDARAIEEQAALPAALIAIPMPEQLSIGETAFYHRGSRSLIVGEAVAGAPAGQLSLSATLPERDAARAARALRVLLARDLQRLLVAAGDSLMQDPTRALQDLLYRHDPAAFLLRRDELCWREPFQGGQRYRQDWAECARLIGLTAHNFDLSSIPPGKENFPLHRHDGREELYYVVEGQGEVRTEQGTFAIAAGDVLGFPPRYQVAHAVRNTGEGDLRYLSFSSWAEQIDMNDYPESGQRSEGTPYGKSRRFFLPERVDVGYWERTPTD
jgi:uncharacterized cupin superfamily protein